MTFIRIYFLFSCKSFNLWTNNRVSIWQLQWDELPKQNPGSVRKGAEEDGRTHKSLLTPALIPIKRQGFSSPRVRTSPNSPTVDNISQRNPDSLYPVSPNNSLFSALLLQLLSTSSLQPQTLPVRPQRG